MAPDARDGGPQHPYTVAVALIHGTVTQSTSQIVICMIPRSARSRRKSRCARGERMPHAGSDLCACSSSRGGVVHEATCAIIAAITRPDVGRRSRVEIPRSRGRTLAAANVDRLGALWRSRRCGCGDIVTHACLMRIDCERPMLVLVAALCLGTPIADRAFAADASYPNGRSLSAFCAGGVR